MENAYHAKRIVMIAIKMDARHAKLDLHWFKNLVFNVIKNVKMLAMGFVLTYNSIVFSILVKRISFIWMEIAMIAMIFTIIANDVIL